MKRLSLSLSMAIGLFLPQVTFAVEPDESTIVQAPHIGGQGAMSQPAVFYRRIVDGDLVMTVAKVDDDATKGPLLCVMGPDALQHPNRDLRIGDATKRGIPLSLPDELVGRPSLQVPLYLTGRRVWKFHVNRRVRLYAYIRFPLDQPAPESWKIYQRSPFQPQVLYYRDFPAGENTLVLDRAQFVGIGISSLDALSPREQVVLSGHSRSDGQPHWQIANSGRESLARQLTITSYAPPDVEPIGTSSFEIHVGAGETAVVDVPTEGLSQGTVYAIRAELSARGQRWEAWLPYGRFPAPARPPDDDVPLLPFGGYWKLECCEDRELYEHTLRATLYQMRQLGMNTAVLDPGQSKSPWVLDIIHEYGVKAIIRVGNKQGDFIEPPAAVIEHPAVLTLMIGDEPSLDRDWDAYMRTYRMAHERWPQFRTVTATIFDSWGTMSGSDPVRIYGDHLKQFHPILFGRWYPFRKEQFGLLHGVGYRGWLDPRNVARAIDGSGWDVWWVGPNFFGHDELVPYWRIPTGNELKALAHLCLAHRCRGIIGWPLHSHARPQLPEQGPAFAINFLQDTVGWDGTLGAPARHQTHNALAEVGQAMSRAATHLTKMTPLQFQISRWEPSAIEATAHWTTDQQILLYVVNLDHLNTHPAQVWLYCGNKEKLAEKSLRLQAEFRVAQEVFADAEVQLEPETTPEGIYYVRVTLDAVPPGEGRLILLHGSQPDGAFSPKAFNRKIVQRLEQMTEMGLGDD